MSLPRLLIVLISTLTAAPALAADHVTLSGKVVDDAGKPVDHATVLIYHAGVKQGYSTFCPSCYVDCGKRAITNLDGTFTIQGVDSDLLFQLLAVRDRFQPAFVNHVDPLAPIGPAAVLTPKTKTPLPSNMVRGHVVDDQGRPLRDAVVQPEGISTTTLPNGKPSKDEVSMYGTIKGLEPVAITDGKGDFEISHDKGALGMMLLFEARGFAPKLQALSTGVERTTVSVSQGAAVRGRLIDHGQPVAGAEIGLIARNRGGFGGHLTIIGNPYDEIRVGTQADGSFVLADVPSPVEWYVYAKMESVSQRGATEPVPCATRSAGEVVDVGDLHIQPGHRLRGQIVLSDGAKIPPGMRVTIASDRAFDSQTMLIQPDGSFAYAGLPTGAYEIFASVRGYRAANAIGKLSIDHDVDDFKLMLERDIQP
jgi:hypothetical protein